MSLARNAALLMLTLPVCTAELAYILLREKITGVRWIRFALVDGAVSPSPEAIERHSSCSLQLPDYFLRLAHCGDLAWRPADFHGHRRGPSTLAITIRDELRKPVLEWIAN